MSRSLMLVVLAALVLAALFAPSRSESWSWPDQQRSTASAPAAAADRRNVANRQRYEIVDPDSDDFTLPHPEDLNPNRPFTRPPLGPPPGPGPVSRPPNYPLVNPNPGYRPPGYRPPRPLPPPSGPVGNQRPPPGADRYDPSDVSKCKCVHAFNCEANALQFGSCDAGKRYCCTKEPRGGPRPGGYGAPGLGGGSRPAILTGPGGPTGGGFGGGFGGAGPVKDYSPYDRYPGPSAYDRYSDRFPDRYTGPGGVAGAPGAPGVLVGPRPTVYRPNPAAGFSSRPGDYYNNYNNRGPGSSPYRDYDNYNRGDLASADKNVGLIAAHAHGKTDASLG